MLHAGRNGFSGFRIIGAKEIERLVGEDDAKSPGGTFRVLLEDVDLSFRMPALP
jgi:hypothetical protein